MPLDSKNVTPIADRMRQILGPNGENWCRGHLRQDGKFCLMGAYLIALGRKVKDGAYGSDFKDYKERCCEMNTAVERAGFVTDLSDPSYAPRFNNMQTSFAPIARVIDAFAELEAEKALV